jgi:hypothetical protein
MSEWISSLAAVKQLNEAGLYNAKTALGQWAEAGSLKSRARWGRFFFDGCTTDIQFPTEPPADLAGKGAEYPWPDIPCDFWRHVNNGNFYAEAHYEAGIFAALVFLDPELGTGSDTEYIKLFDVSFHSNDLDTLLSAGSTESTEVRPPAKRWQQQRVAPQQAHALMFIDIALTYPRKVPLGRVALHSEYLKWYADLKNKPTGTPLGRSAFGKWQDRYLDGWRASKHHKLEHNP